MDDEEQKIINDSYLISDDLETVYDAVEVAVEEEDEELRATLGKFKEETDMRIVDKIDDIVVEL